MVCATFIISNSYLSLMWPHVQEHSPAKRTYPQRYFVCGEHWKRTENGATAPIFLYIGNEADVTLYLNHTGLMWEAAPDFGALLVFAEHRYYGESKPFKENLREHMEYLTADQAMADYAELMTDLKAELHAEDSAVIGFGGSYGEARSPPVPVCNQKS